MGWRVILAALGVALGTAGLPAVPCGAQQPAVPQSPAAPQPVAPPAAPQAEGAPASALAGRVQSLDRQIVEMHRQGHYAEAIPLAAELLRIYEQALGPEHANVATAAVNLALLYDRVGRPAEAEPLYRRALAIREKLQGPDSPEVAVTLFNLAELERAQGHDGAAEPLYKRALAIREKALGPEHVDVVQTLDSLAQLYAARGRYDDAIPLVQRALAIREKIAGAEAESVGITLNELGTLYVHRTRYADAEPLFKRSLAIAEATVGPENGEVANRLTNLAEVYGEQGRYGEAEPLYRRSLAIREKTAGPDSPAVGVTLNSLASTYLRQGLDAEAIPLLRRSLAIAERGVGADHPSVAQRLMVLATADMAVGAASDAEPLYKRALAIREKALGPEHREVGATLASLGALYRETGRPAEAEPLLRRSLSIREKTLGPDHPDVAETLGDLGAVQLSLKRPQDAERTLERALMIEEAVFGADHPRLARDLDQLAQLHRDQNKLEAALTESRRAVAILTQSVTDATPRRRTPFVRNVALVQAAGGAGATAETFRIAQLAHAASPVGATAMATRIAGGSDALATTVRKRQGLVGDWMVLDQVLTENAGKAAELRKPAEEAEARRYRADIAREIAELDARLAMEFPSYAELTRPPAVTLEAAQALLTGDDALLAWLVGEDETWLWALRRDRASLFRIPLGRAALAQQVTALRERLDPALNPSLRPFDATLAHGLYQQILAPAAALFETVPHLYVVPDGPLESLPLGVLVTRPPRADPEAPADHRAPAWFMRRHAVSVLPTVGALAALRRNPAKTKATVAFVGVGDPALEGKAEPARALKAAGLFRGALAELDAVKKLPPLPETAAGLRAAAKALGTNDSNLFLGKRATEGAFRRAGLERYRVIDIAAPAVTAGPFNGLAEPALVLSPPDQASAEDDGLLTASEIAALKLDADWVLLTACVTAADGDTRAADGVATLARAFQHAGARGVAASHWMAPAEPTGAVVAGVFDALKREPSIGRAEALRRAQLQMLDPSNPPEYAHPQSWGALSLIGDGAAGR